MQCPIPRTSPLLSPTETRHNALHSTKQISLMSDEDKTPNVEQIEGYKNVTVTANTTDIKH